MNTTSNNDFAKLVYVGINLQDILYGIELTLYFTTMHALLNHPGKRTRSDMFLATFSSVMLFTVSIWVFTQAVFGKETWEDPSIASTGSPVANLWYMNLATLSPLVLQLMTDGLMLYRCWMIWCDYRVIIIPSILWFVSLALGIVANWTPTITGGIYFHGSGVKLGLAYFSVSFFLTAMLTCMICYRLILHGRLTRNQLGDGFASPYFALVGLIVESVLPCTLCSAAVLISLGIQSQAITVLGYIHALLLCIAPQMLILRVALKRSTNTGDMRLKRPLSTVVFSPAKHVTSMASSDATYTPYAQISRLSGNEDMV